MSLFGLLLLHLLHVELEFLSLKDVPVASSALSWPGRNTSIQSTGGELLIKKRVELPVLLSRSNLSGQAATSLGFDDALLNLLSLNFLDSYLDTIV